MSDGARALEANHTHVLEFDEIVEGYLLSIARKLHRTMRDVDVEDLLQDLRCKAVKVQRKYRFANQRHAMGFLVQCVSNEASTLVSSWKRKPMSYCVVLPEGDDADFLDYLVSMRDTEYGMEEATHRAMDYGKVDPWKNIPEPLQSLLKECKAQLEKRKDSRISRREDPENALERRVDRALLAYKRAHNRPFPKQRRENGRRENCAQQRERLRNMLSDERLSFYLSRAH